MPHYLSHKVRCFFPSLPSNLLQEQGFLGARSGHLAGGAGAASQHTAPHSAGIVDISARHLTQLCNAERHIRDWCARGELAIITSKVERQREGCQETSIRKVCWTLFGVAEGPFTTFSEPFCMFTLCWGHSEDTKASTDAVNKYQ